MSVSTPKIIFEYIHCDKTTLESQDVGFSETMFTAELNKAFETILDVQNIYVEIKHEPAHSTDKFTCLIQVKGPNVDFSMEQRGSNATGVTRECVHKTLKQIYIDKEKLTY